MSNFILQCGKVWYICVLFIIKLKVMQKTQDVKIMVDLSVLVDLSQVAQILFNMVKDKDLSAQEVEQMQFVGDLMENASLKFENAINMMHNDN
jgi:hypothetical protein